MQASQPFRDHLPRLAIVGAGRVGSVFAHAFSAAGWPVVACCSRTTAHSEHLAGAIPGCRVAATPDGAAAEADWIFVTVADDAIAAVAREITWRPEQLALHPSGALPAAILEAATAGGARVGGFHPLQSFADPEASLGNLRGSSIGIESDQGDWPALAELAVAVGAHPLHIVPEDRALYHLGSVLVSNFSVGLLALATEVWGTIGIDEATATAALVPLLEGTVRNIRSLGVAAALTGPAVRGDAGTITRHMQALEGHPAERDVYQALTRILVGIAQERRGLASDRVAAIGAALNPTGEAVRR